MTRAFIDAYQNREVVFSYRGRPYTFALSQGLFSSAGIDKGSRFLLKVFSAYIDSDEFIHNAPFEREKQFKVLDAGSGTGVLGICAAGALSTLIQKQEPLLGGTISVRSQDRDELARVFTEHNARLNGLEEDVFSAHAEPLLAGPSGWDIILSNIPAKAGRPVLEDFISRSISLLRDEEQRQGRVLLVAVNTLAEFFFRHIKNTAYLHNMEKGSEHTVFVFGKSSGMMQGTPLSLDGSFHKDYPFYIRNKSEYEMAGISYKLDTIHGAAGFDNPGGEAEAAAKLVQKIALSEKLSKFPANKNVPVRFLVHDAGQGHFALWLEQYLDTHAGEAILAGRNVLALNTALYNINNANPSLNIAAVQSADILLDCEKLLVNGAFGLVAYFPEIIPKTNREEAAWEALGSLTVPCALIIAAMGTSDAERFDRKKTLIWQRLGDIRRKGFRAIIYQKKAEA